LNIPKILILNQWITACIAFQRETNAIMSLCILLMITTAFNSQLSSIKSNIHLYSP